MYEALRFCRVWYAIEILTLFLITGVLIPSDRFPPLELGPNHNQILGAAASWPSCNIFTMFEGQVLFLGKNLE